MLASSFQKSHNVALVAAPLVLSLLWAPQIVVNGQMDICGVDLSSILPPPFNDSSALACMTVWRSFILRYSQRQGNVLSIVLSASYTSGWVGMGFSRDGMMVGSSAMVGWISKEGRANVKQYFLRGLTPSEVIANVGQLQVTDVSPVVVRTGATIYLAFQLKFAVPVTQQQLIFADSTSTPIQNLLAKHDDRTTVLFDFSSGKTSSSYPDQLKTIHGSLAIVGWGVLLPLGAIIARYCRHWDPQWFHLHSTIQIVGFFVGLSSVLAGLTLYDKLHANVSAHRTLGIVIFVLGILQVNAFCLRPQKDSKIRKYWNQSHHWVGRLLLFLAAVNIVVGIQVAGAGIEWKVGYGFNVTIILITFIFLEPKLRMKGAHGDT